MAAVRKLPPTVSAQLGALREGYAGKLAAKLDELRSTLDAARGADPASAAIRDAARLAHKLHGTAGTYGFAEVSDAAGVLEDALGRARAGAPDASAWAEVDAALGHLAAAIGAATGG